MLTDNGTITISGGCEVYAEATIRLLPKRNTTLIQLNNHGNYFYDTSSQPVASFQIEASNDIVTPFVQKMVALIDSPSRPPGQFTTRGAVVAFHLPVSSRTLSGKWDENKGEYDLDPLLDTITQLVEICIALAEKRSEKSNQNHLHEKKTLLLKTATPVNETTAFLGTMAHRQTAIIQYSDMHGPQTDGNSGRKKSPADPRRALWRVAPARINDPKAMEKLFYPFSRRLTSPFHWTITPIKII